MARQQTLTLPIGVRIPVPQPFLSFPAVLLVRIFLFNPPFPIFSGKVLRKNSVIMAGKKKKRRRKGRQAPPAARLSVPQLRERLDRLLEQGKDRDALRLAKELVKREDVPENRHVLSLAYLGRIRGLADRGMLKEAGALVDTMISRCGSVEGTDRLRLVLSIRAASWQEAARHYVRCLPGLAAEERQKVETLFGALLLSGFRELRELLPPDSSVVSHLAPSREALRSFCKGHGKEVRAALGKIPFRSPYRDFRLLLNGCLLQDADPDAAEQSFGRISSDSPYAAIATACRCQTLGGRQVLAAWQHGTAAEQEMFAEALGLGVRETRFIESLAGASLDGYKMYLLITSRNGSLLPAATRKDLLRRLLPHCREKIIDILPRLRGMTQAEAIRCTALAAEADGVFDVAFDFWEQYLDDMDSGDPGYALKAALILRRLAGLEERSGGIFAQKKKQEYLYRSLQHDPTDVDTWLEVIRLSEQREGLKRSYQLVNEALARLPEEPRILLAAMEAAAQRRAFKKAASLARQVLAVDPINTGAADFLLASHLGHGRKLVRQGKMDLARREFEEADVETRSLRYRGRARICLGMLCLLERDRDEGRQWIEAGWMVNGSPLFSRLLTLLEAHLFELPPARTREFARELRAAVGKEKKPAREDVLRLTDWMNSCTGQEWLLLCQCVRTIKGYLSRAGELRWDRDEGLVLCRALHQGGFLVALARVVGPLRRKWPDDPLIEAYELVSRTRDNGRFLVRGDGGRMLELANALEDSGNPLLVRTLQEEYNRAVARGQERPGKFPVNIFDLPLEQFFDFDDDDNDDDDSFSPKQLDLF